MANEVTPETILAGAMGPNSVTVDGTSVTSGNSETNSMHWALLSPTETPSRNDAALGA